ncbi:hypothetical protein [Chitinophaga nivalis]|uniref:GLPGLI family protein n=1 Tax=Chitinophaga nivalis TaxID=2991709 RepID=A0ABT3IV80_9BACT|nr:hypothetical protein [Chitinophaga nivalis]MCW3462456.1 hypothetical protein [Chitinophaga nivalis]MCW3487853.1 hypothetical protein [Chitinophaga nivalis]
MQRTIRLLLAAAASLLAAQPVSAQLSGVIEYEVTTKTDPERMRGFRGNQEEAPEIPDLITFRQTFTFNKQTGKLVTERPAFRGGGNIGDSSRYPRREGARFRGNNALYADLAQRKFLHLFTTSGDTAATYYTTEDFLINSGDAAGGKTKKIAGYTCRKTTIQLKDDNYTVWYTTELPFSFSPINGLLPDSNAVVLAATGSKRGFTATSVRLQPVDARELVLPANAISISPDQLKALRKQEMEKLRKRQSQM